MLKEGNPILALSYPTSPLFEHPKKGLLPESLKRFDKMDKHFDNLEGNFHEFRIMFENSESNQKLILDAVLSIQEKFGKYEKLDDQVQEHGHRIAAVEHFVARHPD